ncbi:hypothetical protein V6N13_073949 [Hibiscus sabdariffa]
MATEAEALRVRSRLHDNRTDILEEECVAVPIPLKRTPRRIEGVVSGDNMDVVSRCLIGRSSIGEEDKSFKLQFQVLRVRFKGNGVEGISSREIKEGPLSLDWGIPVQCDPRQTIISHAPEIKGVGSRIV